MIPQSSIDVELTTQESIETSRTYKIAGDRIQGYTDNLQAPSKLSIKFSTLKGMNIRYIALTMGLSWKTFWAKTLYMCKSNSKEGFGSASLGMIELRKLTISSLK